MVRQRQVGTGGAEAHRHRAPGRGWQELPLSRGRDAGRSVRRRRLLRIEWNQPGRREQGRGRSRGRHDLAAGSDGQGRPERPALDAPRRRDAYQGPPDDVEAGDHSGRTGQQDGVVGQCRRRRRLIPHLRRGQQGHQGARGGNGQCRHDLGRQRGNAGGRPPGRVLGRGSPRRPPRGQRIHLHGLQADRQRPGRDEDPGGERRLERDGEGSRHRAPKSKSPALPSCSATTARGRSTRHEARS